MVCGKYGQHKIVCLNMDSLIWFSLKKLPKAKLSKAFSSALALTETIP